jgi:hypothetical protein
MQLKKWLPDSISVSIFGENISAVDNVYIQWNHDLIQITEDL